MGATMGKMLTAGMLASARENPESAVATRDGKRIEDPEEKNKFLEDFAAKQGLSFSTPRPASRVGSQQTPLSNSTERATTAQKKEAAMKRVRRMSRPLVGSTTYNRLGP
jgi:hypothetical protein